METITNYLNAHLGEATALCVLIGILLGTLLGAWLHGDLDHK